ncbi:MAG: hypothetical protein DRI97_16720 [Bacteroidetes bacterium]|nr:MAG: hypothetical protein DRI97_16720 [Bacteroidota bacterium]
MMKTLKKYSPKILLFLMLGIIAASCTERIDVELDDTYTRLVVDGQLTGDSTETHTIILTESTSYFYNQPPPPVTNANVSVKGDDGSSILLSEQDPCVYLLPEGFKSKIGVNYSLDIDLEKEIDGHIKYTASSSTPSIGDTVYIGLQYQPDWGEKGYYVVQCYYWDPLGPNWYMFDIYKNDTLLTDTISEKQVVDDTFYDGGFTNGIGVGYLDQSRKDQVLKPGDVISFRASSITEGYANFVWEVQDEVSFSTPLFSGPPANVVGNLSDGAIGYFTSYSVLFASMVFE